MQPWHCIGKYDFHEATGAIQKSFLKKTMHWWHNNMPRHNAYLVFTMWATMQKIISFEKFQKLLILCGKKYLRVGLLFIASNSLRILNKASRLFPCEISRWFLLLPLPSSLFPCFSDCLNLQMRGEEKQGKGDFMHEKTFSLIMLSKFLRKNPKGLYLKNARQ